MSTSQRLYAEVKSFTETEDAEHPNGSFTAILSTPALDRDDEILDPRAGILPKSIPIYADHEQYTVRSIVGRAVPTYDDDGNMRLVGYYGSDAFSQEVRTKVREGLIDSMSVGFIRPIRERDSVDGKVHVRKYEVIEGSFVGVPANPEAVVTSAKSLDLADGEGMADDIKTEATAPAAPAPEYHPEIALEADALDAQLEALEALDEMGELDALLSEFDDESEDDE